jgi:hypothetical protein
MMDGLPPGSRSIVQDGLDEATQSLFSAADVPLAKAEELRAAVTSPAVRAVLEMRIEQIVKHGHDAEADLMLPILWLPKQAHEYAQIAVESVGVTGRDRDLERACKCLARTAALSIAAIDRIRAAIERREG